jgi:hypothetical protein
MSRDSLLTLRVLLAGNGSNEQVQPILAATKQDFDQTDSPFRELLIEAIDCISERVDRGDRENALRLVQFIHNVPTTAGELDSWDEAHFLQIELPTYLESESDIGRLKRVLALVGPHAART